MPLVLKTERQVRYKFQFTAKLSDEEEQKLRKLISRRLNLLMNKVWKEYEPVRSEWGPDENRT